MNEPTPFRTKQLIARPNASKFGSTVVQIGYDVGWRVYGQEGLGSEIYWGNTKNSQSFRSMVEDARKQGYEFDLDESAERLLRGDL